MPKKHNWVSEKITDGNATKGKKKVFISGRILHVEKVFMSLGKICDLIS